MENARKLPSLIGCAIGFCTAGSGVGSLIGVALGPWLYSPLPEGQGTQQEQILAMYGGTFLGIKVGMAVGAITGVLYAVMVRRTRFRPQTPESFSGSRRQEENQPP